MGIAVSLGTDPATGKRRTATASVKGDRRAAEKELRRLLRTLDTGEHVDPTRMTLGAWLTQWHETKREEVSPKTDERYGEIVNNFLIPALGALPLAKLAPSITLIRRTVSGPQEAVETGKPGAFPHSRADIYTLFSSQHCPVPSNINCSLAIRLTSLPNGCPKLNAKRW